MLCRAKAKKRRRKRKTKAKAEGDAGSATGESEGATEAGGDEPLSPVPATASSACLKHSASSEAQQAGSREQSSRQSAEALNGPKAEAKEEDKAAASKGSGQPPAVKGINAAPANAHRANREDDEDSAADSGTQHEVRERLDAAIAAALETLELGSEAAGLQAHS